MTTRAPSKDVFPFLSLPRELRDLVYEYTLGSRLYRLQRSRQRKESYCSNCSQSRPPRQHFFGILAVCSQIYNEARPVPFTHNTFFLEKSSTLLSLLEPWQIATIRHIRLQTFPLIVDAPGCDEKKFRLWVRSVIARVSTWVSLPALRTVKAPKARIITLHSARIEVYHPTFEFDAVFEMEVRSK